MWSRTLSALITQSQKRISLVTKTCVSSSRKRAEKPCGMQLHFLRKSNIGQTNVTRFFSSRAPLPWLNSDSFPPRPMIFITSGIVNTKFDRRLQPLSVDLSIKPFCRSRSYSYGSEAGLKVSDYFIQSGPDPRGGGTPHMKAEGMLVGNFELDR